MRVLHATVMWIPPCIMRRQQVPGLVHVLLWITYSREVNKPVTACCLYACVQPLARKPGAHT